MDNLSVCSRSNGPSSVENGTTGTKNVPLASFFLPVTCKSGGIDSINVPALWSLTQVLKTLDNAFTSS